MELGNIWLLRSTCNKATGKAPIGGRLECLSTRCLQGMIESQNITLRRRFKNPCFIVRKTPFDPDSDQSSWEKIKAYLVKPPTPPSHFESLAKDIVNKFLVTVENRLGCGPDGVAEIKRHPWFQGTNWDAIMQRQVPGPIHLRT